MQAGIITFPGSNCDRDMFDAVAKFASKTHKIWHKDKSLPDNIDFIAIPGGFSYGDYLRCGALAAHSPIMSEIIKFANSGGLVLGVCNGFQILIEAGLLPGILQRNKNLNFIAKDTILTIENKHSKFSKKINKDEITIPIAHHDGNYFCSNSDYIKLKENEQIIFSYKDNPNGSIQNIAGITNKNGNVLGMMPHPERAINKLIGGEDGLSIFASIFA